MNNSQPKRQPPINWRATWPFLAGFIILVALPEVITWLTMPDGLVFNGAFVNITDFNVYLSAIRQGAEGRWLFNPQFTPEITPAYLSFLPYILMGKLQATLGGSSLLWYQILKVISWALAVTALFELIRMLFPEKPRLQRTAVIMLLFSSGLGWLVILSFGELTPFTPDLYVPEWSMITAAFAAPHFLIGIAAQAGFFASMIKLYPNFAPRQSFRQLLIGIALSLTYPYQIVVDGMALATFFLLESIRLKKIPWKAILSTAALCLPMIAALIYYGLILPADPVYQIVVVANNFIVPPPPSGFLIGFGLLIPLVILGFRPWWQDQRKRLVAIWLICNLIAIYLPLSFSGRFMIALFVPVVLIAAYGLEEILLPKVGNRLKPRLTRNILLLFTVPSTLMFVLYFFMVVNSYPVFPYYNRLADQEATAWLGKITTEDDLVLAAFPVNNLLPRYGKGHVFNGHFDLTLDLEGKTETMETFWAPDTRESWRQSFIEEWGFDYLYQGYFENSSNDGQPFNFPYNIIYQSEEVTIYKFP